MSSKMQMLPKGTTFEEIKEKYIIQPLQVKLLQLESDIQITKDPNFKKALLFEYKKTENKLKEVLNSPDILPKKNKKQVEPESVKEETDGQ